MGVATHPTGQWRAFATDADGKAHVKYFSTEADAVAFHNNVTKGRKAHTRFTKRSSAKDQSLPVGIHETVENRRAPNGTEYRYRLIVGTAVVEGKNKTIRRTFHDARSGKRTRDEAIKICVEWRKKILKPMKPLETRNKTDVIY